MAIQIKNTYSGRTDNTDPNYPYGKGRNVVGGVEGTGTPFEADWYNNLEGFLQGLLLEAGITPDGQVDNANSSQLVEAVKGIAREGLVGKIFQSPTDGGLTEIQTRTVNANEVYEVRKTSDDSLATIYSDAAGTTEIVQDGIDNVSGSDGVVEFYIADGGYAVTINAVSTGFKTSSAEMESTVNEISSGEFNVGTSVRLSDRGYAKFKVLSGGIANGYDILDAGGGNTAVLVSGIVIDAAAFGVNGSSDGLNVQAIYDYVSSAAVVNFGSLNVDADTIVTLESKDNITTIGGVWHWNHQGSNMIKLAGTLKNPTFRLKEIYGNSDSFVSQGAIGCFSGTVTENWSVNVGKIRDLPFGVYINADSSGSHINPRVENTMFENMTRFANDSQSGAGIGLVFASDAANGGGSIVGGKSVGNIFKRCERHGLYVSNGGNVTSIDDVFIEHREGMAGTMPIELAAAQIARSAYNFKMINPTFINCNDLALAIQAVQTGGTQTFGSGVDVISPTFDGNKAVDIKINNDSPSVNGHIDNIKISGVTINQYGDNQNNRIQIFAGIGNRIKGITVNSDTTRGALELVDIVRIFDNANQSELDDLVIEDLKGSVFGTSSRGVNVNNGILSGTHKVTLKDIFAGTTKIRQTVANTNYDYRVFENEVNLLNSAFTAQFNDVTSVVNNQDKYFGKMLYTRSNDVVSARPVFATGSSPTDSWNSADGTLVYSPS